MNYLKEIGKAIKEGKIIVFNFTDTELHYAHRDWMVFEVGKRD